MSALALIFGLERKRLAFYDEVFYKCRDKPDMHLVIGNLR